MMNAAEIGLIGSRVGVFDLPCPDCGPERRSVANQRRKVLRVWRSADDFVTWCCARCGTTGHSFGGRKRPRDPIAVQGSPTRSWHAARLKSGRSACKRHSGFGDAATDPRQHRRTLSPRGARLHRAAPGHARVSPSPRRIPACDDRRLRHSNGTGARHSLDLRQRRSRRASHPLAARRLRQGRRSLERSWSATPSARRSCSPR